jgi:hypothetical protein
MLCLKRVAFKVISKSAEFFGVPHVERHSVIPPVIPKSFSIREVLQVIGVELSQLAHRDSRGTGYANFNGTNINLGDKDPRRGNVVSRIGDRDCA